MVGIEKADFVAVENGGLGDTKLDGLICRHSEQLPIVVGHRTESLCGQRREWDNNRKIGRVP